jgi:hypothetical protein
MRAKKALSQTRVITFGFDLFVFFANTTAATVTRRAIAGEKNIALRISIFVPLMP